jgi:hypothetical protein
MDTKPKACSDKMVSNKSERGNLILREMLKEILEREKILKKGFFEFPVGAFCQCRRKLISSFDQKLVNKFTKKKKPALNSVDQFHPNANYWTIFPETKKISSLKKTCFLIASALSN